MSLPTEASVVLWICGPPGAGKTTVAWEIWSELRAAGVAAAYVDIDQLGMSIPSLAGDPGRHRVQAGNLAAIVPIYRAAGARCVIVSGVVDPEKARTYADLIPAKVTLLRLRLDHDEIRRRLVARGGWAPAMIDEAITEAVDLDLRDNADVCIDTTGRSVADVVRLVREHVGGSAAPAEDPVALPDAGLPILWLCGATGSGKSTVGWTIFTQIRAAGLRVAFVDLEQIGFFDPAPAGDPDNHGLKARNLAAMARTFADGGAQCLIIVGAVADHDQVRAYTDALPRATITLVRLHAGAERLAERVMRRGDGEGPQLPGESLAGRDPVLLRQVAAASAADAVRLAANGIADLCIDTDDMSIDDVAQAIRAQIGDWPSSCKRSWDLSAAV